MRKLLVSAIALSIVLSAGCNSAKSPHVVGNNVAAAQQKAVIEVATSERDVAADIGKSANDRKAARATCSALARDTQKACEAKVDADYGAATANAKTAEAPAHQ